jgi:hypothetical protein
VSEEDVMEFAILNNLIEATNHVLPLPERPTLQEVFDNEVRRRLPKEYWE